MSVVAPLCDHDFPERDGFCTGCRVARSGAALEAALLRGALKALVERLKFVHADVAYESVWIVNQQHAGPYLGPTYTSELCAAMDLLAKLEEAS